ncbi:uncharacterized protein LOC129590910 [Paramacrobiotus metropolitanus]|uniref:uncharacterized protein LOC129590910 n=1 Tax=Paramacrobiotus metropolitanus TaxID=2943436 RepID=UPI002445F9A9|nr:uncharacterized protein LOC129590910 [Paramacrobiotus metropolitanus]
MRMPRLFTCLLVLSVASNVVGVLTRCFGHCQCERMEGVVNCAGRDLTTVPTLRSPEKWVQIVLFQKNRLYGVPYTALAHFFPRLRLFDVRGNPILDCREPPTVNFTVLSDCGRLPSTATTTVALNTTDSGTGISPSSAATSIATDHGPVPMTKPPAEDPDSAFSAPNVVYAIIGVLAFIAAISTAVVIVRRRCTVAPLAQALSNESNEMSMDDSMEIPELLPVSTGLPRTTPPSSTEHVIRRKIGKPLTTDIGDSDSSDEEGNATPQPKAGTSGHSEHDTPAQTGDEASMSTLAAVNRMISTVRTPTADSVELAGDEGADEADAAANRADLEEMGVGEEPEAGMDAAVESNAAESDEDALHSSASGTTAECGARAVSAAGSSTRAPDPDRILTRRLGREAMRKLRERMNSVELICGRMAFQRLVREIMESMRPDFSIHSAALFALQEKTEFLFIKICEKGAAAADHAQRVTVMPRDLDLAQYAREQNWRNDPRFSPEGGINKYRNYQKQRRQNLYVPAAAPQRSATAVAVKPTGHAGWKRPLALESSDEDEEVAPIPTSPTPCTRGRGMQPARAIRGRGKGVSTRGRTAAAEVQRTRSPSRAPGTAVCSRGVRRGRPARGARGSRGTRTTAPVHRRTPSPTPPRSVQPVRRGAGGAKRICLGRPNGVNPSQPPTPHPQPRIAIGPPGSACSPSFLASRRAYDRAIAAHRRRFAEERAARSGQRPAAAQDPSSSSSSASSDQPSNASIDFIRPREAEGPAEGMQLLGGVRKPNGVVVAVDGNITRVPAGEMTAKQFHNRQRLF